MNQLTLEEVEYVAHYLAQKLMDWGQPIPPFSTRDPHKLESCLATPFQSFDNKKFYKTNIDKAAVMFYLMNKNHPFKNGNKRIAVTTLLYFLSKNGKWLTVHPQELYKFALFVAESPPKFQKEIVGVIRKFVKGNLTEFPSNRKPSKILLV